MLENLLSRFRGEHTMEVHEEELRIAVAALMMAMLRSADLDADATPAMISVLADRYTLNDEDAKSLGAQSEIAEAASVDAYRFSHLIKTAFTMSDRRTLVFDMWRAAGGEKMRAACAEFMGKLEHLLDLPAGSVKAIRSQLED